MLVYNCHISIETRSPVFTEIYSPKDCISLVCRRFSFCAIICLMPLKTVHNPRAVFGIPHTAKWILILFFLFLVPGPCFLLPAAFAATDELFYLHTDHLGSTTVITDESGEVVSQERNYPYGEDRINADGQRIITERSYTSQVEDKAISLYYYNARYYDPVLGTFTSADTANDGLNRFDYVDGNPVMATDPSGNRVLPPRSPWPWDSWVSSMRERYYSSNYRQEQLSMNPAFVVSESVPFISSLGLLSSAGLEAATGDSENAGDALAGSVALLFPNNENPTALAMDIAGMSAVISAPRPWDGAGPGTNTMRIGRDYSSSYGEDAFVGAYRRRPERLYKFQEHIVDYAKAVREGMEMDRQGWLDWAAREGIEVNQVPRGHPRLGLNRGVSRGGSVYIDSGLDDIGFLETFGHEIGHEYDKMFDYAASSMETECRQTYWSQHFWGEVGDYDLSDHYWRRYQLLRGRQPPE